MDVSQTIAIALQHHQAGNLLQAEQLYRSILEQEPEQVRALHLLGVIAFQTHHPDDAIALYQQVIAIEPDYVWVYNDLGTALRQQGDIETAIAAYQEAIALQPDFVHAHYNLGNAFREQGDMAAAITAYQQAIALNPEFTEAYYNLGGVLHDQGNLEEAIACYHTILTFNPGYVNAHWNLAIASLLLGDLTTGLAEFEWRWQLPEQPPRAFKEPLWDGSFWQGQRLLLHAEQGFGDTIQFSRYVPLVAQRAAQQGGQVIVECQPALMRLLAAMDGIDHLVPRDAPLPDFDVQAPLMSLPWLFGTTLDTIPADIPYLTAPSSPLLQRSPQARFHVGLVWAGNPERQSDGDRSCPLRYVQPILDISGVAVYSLQKGEAAAELKHLGIESKLLDLSSQLHDFADTAAIITQLDLVITVDTAVAHLAGALGHPVWVLLSHLPDWRWLLERNDSPWYPGMRLFRQPSPGDWQGVFEQVKEALQSVE
ncbi:glycosyltransferase family protein [Oculatella sp. LEGE 06141]|uniref:tetratricopeptide repeat-containing glycosyltransferase family protein n=1 Tax=Oculatella sp. LEGE 06141 TaxID=1828648 RepID=UPI0018830D1D|nr:tetratricopeptide repeat-containing glycosyltransferase family protein [Oculatella sp. LEGE 06141]MBE9177197.1 glycosyltransferase family protein [Oculatella sp. LEGE 06141]